ncbi:MAG: hypothetical protein BJ554DRAFT_5986, partial [Olpidium bornovanus]
MKSTQQQKINKFRAVSQASEKVAIKTLKQHNWNVSLDWPHSWKLGPEPGDLELAVDDFFGGGASSVSSPANSSSASAINAIFDKYKGMGINQQLHTGCSM